MHARKWGPYYWVHAERDDSDDMHTVFVRLRDDPRLSGYGRAAVLEHAIALGVVDLEAQRQNG